MTRINCGIEPSELVNKHLLAEHRELVRIPNCVNKGRFNLKNQPKSFTLGTGHVSFFYTRLLYLKKRYEQLYSECIKRGFNVQYYGNTWDNSPVELMNDYTPTDYDRQIIRDRISERLNSKTV